MPAYQSRLASKFKDIFEKLWWINVWLLYWRQLAINCLKFKWRHCWVKYPFTKIISKKSNLIKDISWEYRQEVN